MKTKRIWALGLAMLLTAVLMAAVVRSDERETKFKGVIASTDTALANDGSKIILTGSVTFEPGDSDDVTGGGTWQTIAPNGMTVTGSGTYKVTRLVKFDLAPGAVANPTIHAGLGFFRVAYSDGSKGILVLSCHLPGTPDSVFEGATASKGFVDYWNRTPSGTFFQALTENDD